MEFTKFLQDLGYEGTQRLCKKIEDRYLQLQPFAFDHY